MLGHQNSIKDHKAESMLFKRRALIAFLGILLLMLGLIVNLYKIQITQYKTYEIRANNNRIKVIPIGAKRGLIYDRNGKLMADNRPVYNLDIIPERVTNLDQTLTELQALLNIPDEIIERFYQIQIQTRRFRSLSLLQQLTQEQVTIFSVNRHKFPGVEVVASLKRFYPYGDVLTHVIGYVSRINDSDVNKLKERGQESNYKATKDIGKLGIEAYYENMLHGTSGYKEVEVNNLGRIIRTLKYIPPVPGKNIVLNLDVDLQLYAFSQMRNRKGSIVILDPKDNSVLALVSTPSYDPNAFVHGISTDDFNALLTDVDLPLINRSTLGVYPPASIVKPMIAVAALQEGVITEKTTRNDPGYWRIPNSDTRAFRDWLRWGHGEVDILKAIEESVDTFFYQIVYELGIDRISPWMNLFGFGYPTGIDIHEETDANMPTREWKMVRYQTPWYQGDTIPVGIGQGYWTATPVQMAKAISILVNRGTVYTPRILKATFGNDESFEEKVAVASENPTSIAGVSEQYWDLAIEGMRRVNHGERGTARQTFKWSPYETAGKSGTAQLFELEEDELYNVEEVTENLRDHAIYVGFAPIKDPKVLVSIVLENAGGGSSNAAPIVRNIFNQVLFVE